MEGSNENIEKIIGDNSHGFDNEPAICNELNNKRLDQLNSNLKIFIQEIALGKSLNISNNTIITCRVETNNKLKQDLIITINSTDIYISVKMGSGNSVHQEKVEDFINFLNEGSSNVPNEVEDAIRLFIWADGSLDGNAEIEYNNEGKVIGRFGAREFAKIYPEKRKIIQVYLNNHKEELMRRFLFFGSNNSKIDYIYYGTPYNGSWIAAQELINYNLENPQYNKTLNLGRMGIQSWNVDLKNNNPQKRGVVQVKYGQLSKDLEHLLLLKAKNKGTNIGDKSEFDISRTLNKNKNNESWKVLKKSLNINDNSDLFVVKVTKRVYSSISKGLVFPKSDAYLIKSKMNQNTLFKHNHELTEDTLYRENIKYSIVPNSGISIKRIDSKSFTIVKMTNNSFHSFFSDYLNPSNLYFCGALLYVTDSGIHKNQKIMQDLDVKELDLLNLVGDNELNTATFKKIKNYCTKKIKETIDNNNKLKLSLFTGKGIYEDPYYASFTMKFGNLTDDILYDFSITTGSGRTKGKYTIILKPLIN